MHVAFFFVLSAASHNGEIKIYNAARNVVGFSVSLLCTGLLSTDVDIRIQMNVSRASNVIILDIRRKKACLRGTSFLYSHPYSPFMVANAQK